MPLTRAEAKIILADFEKLIKPFAKKHSGSFKTSMSWTDEQFALRLVVAQDVAVSKPKKTAPMPKAKGKVKLCKYCKKAEQNPFNNGACHKSKCVLQAMRDSL